MTSEGKKGTTTVLKQELGGAGSDRQKLYVQKRLSLVPKITYCIILEMIYMFLYLVLSVICRHEFSS